MRPTAFDPQRLRTYLHRHTIADLPALKHALGTSADLTVFRKLRSLGYLSSYTHRGRFYTLRTIARFDDDGLWSHEAVWFSRHGTLMATLVAWIAQAPQGWFADELADRLHVDVHDPLHDLVRQGLPASAVFSTMAAAVSSHEVSMPRMSMVRAKGSRKNKYSSNLGPLS